MNLIKENAFTYINIFYASYLFIFFIRAILLKNYEFLAYILLFIVILIVSNLFFEKYLRKYISLYFFVSVFILIHILGGVITIGDHRLYEHYFLDTIRFDWFMHILGGFLSAAIAYEIVKDNFLYTKNSYQLLIAIIIVLSIGVGTINEIIEFMAVLFLNASKNVGDYYNNLTDICNNLLGSIIYLLYFSKTHKFKEYDFAKMKHIKSKE